MPLVCLEKERISFRYIMSEVVVVAAVEVTKGGEAGKDIGRKLQEYS